MKPNTYSSEGCVDGENLTKAWGETNPKAAHGWQEAKPSP